MTTADWEQELVAKRIVTDKIATGIGSFSIVLGAAEILAPVAIAQLIGVKPNALLLPALGLRELTSGLGILNGRGRPSQSRDD